jgi:glycosyltransferase involved in cell wall biosynthesis
MRPTPNQADRSMLSIMMPAYNEASNLETTARSMLMALRALKVHFELIIVNDGSRDATPDIADRLAAEAEEIAVIHQKNQGLGGALRTAIHASQGDKLILWPADMPVTAADLDPFVSNMHEADVIVGCRNQRLGYNPLMRFNSWLYPCLVRVLFGLRLRDVNWIQVYPGELMRQLEISQSGIPMLTEALVKLRDKGATFMEVDVAMKPREGGVASASRVKVMVATLRGLLGFWSEWRRHQREASTGNS